jgi:hypothetical protein
VSSDNDENSWNRSHSPQIEDPSTRLLPKISAKIIVRKNKKPVGTPKSITVDVNDEYEEFRAKLHNIIMTKAELDFLDDYSIHLLASWRTKTSIQGNKKPLQAGDYVDFNKEEDYEGVIMDICGTHNASKIGLDKNILCILALVNIGASGEQENGSTLLEVSTPTHQTVHPFISLTLAIACLFIRRQKVSMRNCSRL